MIVLPCHGTGQQHRSMMFPFWGSPAPPNGKEAAEKRVYEPHDESETASAGPAHPSPPPQQQQQDTAALAPATVPAQPSTPIPTRDSRRSSRRTPRKHDAPAFEDAHRQACVRLKSLQASCAHIASTTPDVDVPQRQNVVLWGGGEGSDPSSTAAVDDDGSAAFAFLAKNAKHFGWKDPDDRTFARSWSSSSSSMATSPSATSSSTSVLLSSAKSWASRISLGGGGGGEESSGTTLGDPAAKATYARVRPNDLIVCESLVEDCLRHLQIAIQSSPTTAKNPSHAWVLHGSDEYSFRHWLEAAAPSPNDTEDGTAHQSSPQLDVQAFLMSLKSSDVAWLFRLLEYGQAVKVVSRGPDQPAAVVLTGSTDHSAEHCLSVLGLLQARSRLEVAAEKAGIRAAELQRHALQQRRSNASRASVMATLQRSKIYQQQADQNHQALLNVEHSLSLLESSVTTKQVLQAIKQANGVLKAQRVDLDEVDEVLDDMAEHVELDQQVLDAFKNTNNSTLPLSALDDDELLQELASLSLVDGERAGAATAQQPPSTETPDTASEVQPAPSTPNEEVRLVPTEPKPAPTLAS
jgi:Snf7